MKTKELKPTWQIASNMKDKTKALLLMLKNYTLDPAFINYGGFYHPINGRSYHPDYRTEYLQKIS